MKVAGFTFIRNAILYDFPVVEAISSVLPLCDAFFVAVGNSDDETAGLIRSIAPDKITVIETEWDIHLKTGGFVYAYETNKAFDAIPEDYDWCFYIQGDEVLHEKYLDTVRSAMERWLPVKEVCGLLFSYRHFYGSYDYTGDSRHWYRREVRVIRNDKSIRSYRDAQGFRIDGHKLNVVPVEAEIYHYGWVRHPRFMQQKVEAVRSFYRNATDNEDFTGKPEMEFDFGSNYDALARFEGTHPQVMQNRIKQKNWHITFDLSRRNLPFRYRILYWFEKLTGIRPFEFRNYRILIKYTPERFYKF